MEKYFTIPTSDGFEIKGVLNWKEKSEKLIIFVHGLTGSMTEAHFYAGKEYFTEKGFEVFRFNLYTDGENTRKLKDTNIAEHGEDIETVLDFFSETYGEIFLIGHSLAGPSIIQVVNFPENLYKIIFWDPAFDTSTSAQRCYFEDNKIFRTMSGKEIEFSQEMFKEFLENKHLEILSKLEFPFQKMSIIYADGAHHIEDKPMIDSLSIKSCIIEGANHGFTQEGKYEELFSKTLEYIQK